jgi:hypothetical protein
MSAGSRECFWCHAASAADRATSGSTIYTAPTCLGCLWTRTEAARRKIFEWTGTPFSEDAAQLPHDPTESEIRLAWERHDACHEMFWFLASFEPRVGRGDETFSYGWTGGRVGEPTSLSDEKLERLRALMAARGYEEVACETFSTDNPRGAYVLPRGDDSPHWCTSVEFQKAS